MKFTILAIVGAFAILPVYAGNVRTTEAANAVLGQPDFLTSTAVSPGQANRLKEPSAVAIDLVSGKVFVSDTSNNRVLRFSSTAAAQNGAAAEAVFGQADFTNTQPNQGAAKPGANTLSGPFGLFIDPAGTLWVADASNNRVVGYANAATAATNVSASRLIGQLSFSANALGSGPFSLSHPLGVWMAPSGVLWIADASNNRVLGFDNISRTPVVASRVLGQPDFNSSVNGDGPAGLDSPWGVVGDAAGHLWVSDFDNARVVRYDEVDNKPIGGNADAVLGQTDLDTTVIPFATATSGPSVVAQPTNIDVDSDGSLWVADAHFPTQRVVRFSHAGSLPNDAPADLVLGEKDFASSTPGTTNVNFHSPVDVKVSSDGTVFVADQENNRVLRFNSTPNIHPADTNSDSAVGTNEVAAYRAAFLSGASWPTGPSPVPANYAARAKFIFLQGGNYVDDRTQLPPLNWGP